MDLKLKDMKAQFLGQRVTVEGTVNKTGTQYPFCTKAAFQCLRCGHMHFVSQGSFKLEEPFTGCENDTCGKKGPFKFLPENSTFIDAKEIEISDISGDITDRYGDPNKVNLKVILIGDAVETKIIDQKYKFTGKFTTSEIGRKLEYLLYADKVEIVPAVESTPNDIVSETATMSQRNKIKILRDVIIKVSEKHPGAKAPLEEIYAVAENEHGIDRAHAEEYIKKMKQRGDLLSPDKDHVRYYDGQAVERTPNDVVSEPATMSQRDMNRIMRGVIGQISDKQPYNKASLEEVYTQAEGLGIDRVHAIETIKKMKQRGDLLSPDRDHVRLV